MQAADIFVGILFIGIGIFSFLGAIKNWDSFYESLNAAFITRVFGRSGARILYGLVGISVIAVGILILSGKMH